MKNILLAISLLAFSSVTFAAETKEVCRMEKDKKGKEVKVCKKIKVHKKLEGTKIPTT